MASRNSSNSFRVMTYNVRMDTWQDGDNQWKHRRQRVIDLIQRQSPDLLGVQEPLPEQMRDLRDGLPKYASSGVGRDDGQNHGEFSTIFYRRDRYDLLGEGTFWLSETPEKVGSKGWDAALPRICSWVKLKDRLSKKTISYFNAHLDHKGLTARRESIRVILNQVEKVNGTSSTPTVITGDFNIGPESDPYRTMITNTRFADAKPLSEAKHTGPDGTWSTFNVKNRIGDRIDYIFITPSFIKVLSHAHLTHSENNAYPSDHLPVVADLLLID